MSGEPGRRVGTRTLALTVLTLALLLAGVVSYYAASTPDGLTRVAQDQGFESSATTHATENGPFAGYAAGFVGDDRVSGGLAGVVGVLVVLALGTGLTLLVRRRARSTSVTDASVDTLAGLGRG